MSPRESPRESPALVPTPVEGVNADFPFCWWCLVNLKGPAPGTCTLCRQMPYCSVECQQRHWKCHKEVCDGHKRQEWLALVDLRVKRAEREKEETNIYLEEVERVHGVAGFPPMTADIIPPWNYLHQLSQVQVFRILADLFLDTIHWEWNLKAAGYDDVKGELITTKFRYDRDKGFRAYLERAKHAGLLPGRWSRDLFGRCERFAVDNDEVRTIYDDLDDCELKHYYGILAYKGYQHVYTKLFPQMKSLDSPKVDEALGGDAKGKGKAGEVAEGQEEEREEDVFEEIFQEMDSAEEK